ncbi:EGF-like domain protein [Ancylostoma duodenale]|uniref:EGF-like domain protein n=1 Tax=Ancylostoma duodenale TaxID=51022 RepID=A0A0C2DFA6_9BILA|nr:EGF-like domain protein [Ancylostoma duodenale]
MTSVPYLEAACLCRNGFIGAYCEVDVCSTVPCQHGGSCRANGAEAFCDCLPPYTGLLCESAVAICDPPCANGECVIREDSVTCECKQGFTGTVCNVVDVCFGDAVCSMFGEQAKCVIDEASYTPISSTLYNATYECRCPHPVDGEYVDCLALHLSTSVFESIPTVLPSLRPAVTRVTQTTTSFPTEKLATLESRPTTGTTDSHNNILASTGRKDSQCSEKRPFLCTTTDYPITARTRGQDANFSQKSVSSTILPTVGTIAEFNTFPARVTTDELLNIKLI